LDAHEASNLASRCFQVCERGKDEGARLRRAEACVVACFAGHVATVGDVEEFVLADSPLHTGHYKRVLVALERDGGVAAVDPKPGRRTGTFADPSMKLRFS
jgi:hypothetical protein